MMFSFSFGEPWVLLLLLIVPVLIGFYRLYWKKRKESAMKFSALSMVKSAIDKPKRSVTIRAHLPFILLIIIVTLIIIGLANPMIPLKRAKEGVNVVLAIDDSGSMLATDYQPTRLDAAKNAAATLIRSLKPKDNLGIVIFESGATTACYLTPFKNKAIEKLQGIEQRSGRTALGDGLSLAIDMATSIPNKKKVVILLSDGVNNAGVVSPQEAIQFAKSAKIPVYTVGLGSEKPAVIGYDLFGNPQYAELDEETLKNIAAETGGTYYKSVNERTLDEIYAHIGENIEREWEETSIKDWFFIASFILILVNIYIIYGRYRVVV
jgi:Ca-activated chloride channel family protein